MPIGEAIEEHMEQCNSFRRAFWVLPKKEMTGNIWDSSHSLTGDRPEQVSKVFKVILCIIERKFKAPRECKRLL